MRTSSTSELPNDSAVRSYWKCNVKSILIRKCHSCIRLVYHKFIYLILSKRCMYLHLHWTVDIAKCWYWLGITSSKQNVLKLKWTKKYIQLILARCMPLLISFVSDNFNCEAREETQNYTIEKKNPSPQWDSIQLPPAYYTGTLTNWAIEPIILLLAIVDLFFIANSMNYATTYIQLHLYIFLREAFGEYCGIQIAIYYEIKLKLF